VYLFVGDVGAFPPGGSSRPFRNERQAELVCWRRGRPSRHSAGLLRRCCSTIDWRGWSFRHDRVTREVEFNARLHAFAKHLGFSPARLWPRYRARTKGKGRRGVGYVKKNAIAGGSSRAGRHWEAVSTDGRARVADQRVHGTTGEAPIWIAFGAPRLARCARSLGSPVLRWHASWCARCRLLGHEVDSKCLFVPVAG